MNLIKECARRKQNENEIKLLLKLFLIYYEKIIVNTNRRKNA